jgi:hypothetical protein
MPIAARAPNKRAGARLASTREEGMPGKKVNNTFTRRTFIKTVDERDHITLRRFGFEKSVIDDRGDVVAAQARWH